MVFEDRISAYPNRYYMTDESGNTSYVILERADEPIVPGTPLNAETFNQMMANSNQTGALDISDKITLSWASVGGGHNLNLYVRRHKYVYYPSLKMVFYEVYVEYSGTAAAGETVLFLHVGGYQPNNKETAMPAVSTKLDFSYNYVPQLDYYMFSMHFREAFNDKEANKVAICGWYFCEGE